MGKSEDRIKVLFTIPRYQTYGMDRHYVMPVGVLAVSAYLKRADIADVFTLNLNHGRAGRSIVSG